MKATIKLFLIIVLILGFCGCRKDYSEEHEVASCSLSINQWKTGCDYIQLNVRFSVYGDQYDHFGICYSELNKLPTVDDKVQYGSFGTEQIMISGLKERATYYVREFIQKDDVVAYRSDAHNYTTLARQLPTVSTLSVTDILSASATLRGNISFVGEPAYTSKGICYATSANPTTSNNTIIVAGSGTGSYEGAVNNLVSNTTYYVRAYATNTDGTVYGTQMNFKTLTLPTVSTLSATDITFNSAVLCGNISSVGDPAYTSKGICYATSPNPTTSNGKVTVSGSGTGNFQGTVTGLSGNTTYYARAYATNSAGTAYGEQKSFTTQPTPPGSYYSISLYDTYGDSWLGWNGNHWTYHYVSVKVGDTYILTNITRYDSNIVTEKFYVYQGQSITIYFISGGEFAEECYYKVFDGSGTCIYTSGRPPASVVNL